MFLISSKNLILKIDHRVRVKYEFVIWLVCANVNCAYYEINGKMNWLQKCYVLETLSYSGDHSYNVGCMHQDVSFLYWIEYYTNVMNIVFFCFFCNYYVDYRLLITDSRLLPIIYMTYCVFKVCNQFHTQAAHIFGKRADPVELSLDGDCCSGDLCNHHAIAHSTATTTAAPTDSMCIVYLRKMHIN